MHNSIVADKCKFYMQYIADNNLADKLFDPNKKCLIIWTHIFICISYFKKVVLVMTFFKRF
jgi:hypothetical protein